MHFTFDGSFYKIARTTGPDHNFLGLSFGSCTEPEVIDMNIDPENNKVRINEYELKKQVLMGLKNINTLLGTDYSICKIQYVSSDSPNETIYYELTQLIIKKVETPEKPVRQEN